MHRRKLAVLAFLVASAAWGEDRADLNTIREVTIRGNDIEIVGDKKPNFTTFTMADPPRLVIDISEAIFKGVPETLAGGGHVIGIKTASYASDQGAVARVLIGFDKEVETDIQTVGDTRLVVRLLAPANTPVATNEPPAQQKAEDAGTQTAAIQPKDAGVTVADDPKAAAARAEQEKKRAEAEAKEAARKAEEDRKRADAEAKEAAKRAEADRKAQEEAAKQAEAAARKEADRLAKEQKAAEERAKKDEEQRLKDQKLAEEKARKEAERQEREQKLADEKAKKEAERAAAEEEKRRQAEAAKASAEEKRKAAEDARKAAEEEKRAAAEAAKAAAEAKRKQAEDDRRAAEDAKRAAEEAKRAETEQKRAEAEAQQRAAADKQRAEAEQKRAEAEAAKRAAQEQKAHSEPPPPTPQAEVNVSPRKKTLGFVGFSQQTATSRVYVRTNEPARYSVAEEGAKVVVLTVDNARIDLSNNERILDTSFFDTAVQTIKAMPGQKQTVRVEILLKAPVPYSARQSGNEIWIEFQRPPRK